MKDNEYEVIIIWAWAAGYPAWMYSSRYRMKNLIIWWQPGWTLATTHRVENFPWTKSASWKEIMDSFREQAEDVWTIIVNDMVTEVKRKKDWAFTVKTMQEKVYESRFLIVATGTSHKHLGVPWEKEFYWRGVSYCATCDWMFFRDEAVVVVWWWNTALTQALYLANICKMVYLIHRSENFKCDTCWIEEASKNPKIEIFIIEEIEEIVGDNFWVTGVKLKSGWELEVRWVFVSVWVTPNTQVIDHFNPEKDKEWCLVTDWRQETSVKWIYAAGDITTNSNKFRQAITAAAEWCVAASSVQEDILRSKTRTGVLLYDLGFTAK